MDKKQYDPVAYGFFLQVEAYLRRKDMHGPLAEATATNLVGDLLARTRVAAERSKAGDQSMETTVKRISWGCYVACDETLLSLSLLNGAGPIEERRNVSVRQLQAMDNAMRAIEEAVHIDRAEHRMGDPKLQTGSGQSWGDVLEKRSRELAAVRRLLHGAWAYMDRGAPNAAALVGEELFVFFLERRHTRDQLVEWAEKLVEVHA